MSFCFTVQSYVIIVILQRKQAKNALKDNELAIKTCHFNKKGIICCVRTQQMHHFMSLPYCYEKYCVKCKNHTP